MTRDERRLAKFRCTLRGGQVVEVFAGSEAEARREVAWIGPQVAAAIVAIELDEWWFLRETALEDTR